MRWGTQLRSETPTLCARASCSLQYANPAPEDSTQYSVGHCGTAYQSVPKGRAADCPHFQPAWPGDATKSTRELLPAASGAERAATSTDALSRFYSKLGVVEKARGGWLRTNEKGRDAVPWGVGLFVLECKTLVWLIIPFSASLPPSLSHPSPPLSLPPP
eukprot:6202320-Pleurochrysis_carterae.AAC.1